MEPGAMNPDSTISDSPQMQIRSREAAAPEQAVCPSSWNGIGTIACFVGMVIIFAFVTDRGISYGLRNLGTMHFGAFHRMMQGHVNAEVIVNGSSRAVDHYDPRIIQRITGATAYNLGRNGSQTDMQLAILKTYLKRNDKPRIVIQNLDLVSFEMTKPGAVYEPGFYVPYLAEEEIIYDALVKIDPEVWKWKYIPLYGYAVADMMFTWVTGVRGLLQLQPREQFFLGYHWRDTSWTEDFERFKAANPNGVRRKVEPAGVQTLEELSELCRNQGIQLIFVFSPEYVGMQQLEINRQEVFAQFEDIARKYDVPLWDYSDSPISHNRDFFYNSQHLNGRGASAFTLDLAKRLSQEYFQDGSARVHAR